jgi:Serine dehydrogenase proteinase
MATWSEIITEINRQGPQANLDAIRQRYLKILTEYTGRNAIAIYSGWQQKADLRPASGVSISDAYMIGLMTAVKGLDKTKGLDVILHTPGGEMNATEQIVFYLRSVFKGDLRAIVPHMAMSAGTMIALACKSIVMGLHSCLGPIDPQVGGGPAHGILEEFRGVQKTYEENPKRAEAWVPILKKYTPTLIGSCEKAIKLSETMTTSWLMTGMFADAEKPEEAAKKVVESLGSHAVTLNHSRHITIDQAQNLGLKIVPLEQDARLQDAVLSVHHSFAITFTNSAAVAIIENQDDKRFVFQLNLPQLPMRTPAQPMQFPVRPPA